MKKISSCLMLVLAFLFLATASFATCDGNCVQYCGNPNGSHGYCVDYVQYRLGVSQGRDAKLWQGTDGIGVNEVQVNDVAIFVFGTWGHVAVVDSVDGDYITLSEWNWGGTFIDEPCGVTNEYGTLHSPQRRILKTSVTRFWRPETIAPCESNIQITLQIVGNVGWYPNDRSCVSANAWYSIVEENGEKFATSANEGPSICWNIPYALYGVDYNVIFGTQQLTCQ